MKYELSEKEFEVLHSMVGKVVQAFCDMQSLSLQLNHEYRMKQLDHQEPVSSPATPVEEQKAHHTTVVDYKTRGIDPEVVAAKDRFPEISLSEHQKYGKQLLLEMYTMWLENFRKEGEPQPDRGEYVETLGRKGKQAGAIVSYCMKVGGLTKCLWNLTVENRDLLETVAQDELTPEYVRYVGGNIAQVSSIHLTPLADEFRYPNPLTELEIQC